MSKPNDDLIVNEIGIFRRVIVDGPTGAPVAKQNIGTAEAHNLTAGVGHYSFNPLPSSPSHVLAPAWHPIAKAPEHVQQAAQVQRETPGNVVRLYHGPGLTLYAIHGGDLWVRLPNVVMPKMTKGPDAEAPRP